MKQLSYKFRTKEQFNNLLEEIEEELGKNSYRTVFLNILAEDVPACEIDDMKRIIKQRIPGVKTAGISALPFFPSENRWQKNHG